MSETACRKCSRKPKKKTRQKRVLEEKFCELKTQSHTLHRWGICALLPCFNISGMSFLRGQDAWRRHPIFTWGWKEALPGIREGSAAFALYLAWDFASSKMGKKPAAHDVVHQVGGLEGGASGGGGAGAKGHH